MIKHSYRTVYEADRAYMACTACGATVMESDNPCPVSKEEMIERWQKEFAKGFGY